MQYAMIIPATNMLARFAQTFGIMKNAIEIMEKNKITLPGLP